MLKIDGLQKYLVNLNSKKEEVVAQFHQICGMIQLINEQIKEIQKDEKDLVEADNDGSTSEDKTE